jgi:hypothetical protein
MHRLRIIAYQTDRGWCIVQRYHRDIFSTSFPSFANLLKKTFTNLSVISVSGFVKPACLATLRKSPARAGFVLNCHLK